MSAPDADAVRAALRGWLLATFLPGEPPETLRDDVSLRTQGVLDSMGRITLVSFVEERFAIEVEQEDLRVGALETVDALVALIVRKAG